VVTVSAKGDVEAFRITFSGDPVFETIKNDKRSRIQESAISPEALLPGGPYALWRAGETSRRASDLTRAFAQFPHLPKMLRQRDIIDTLALGCEQGYFVLRLPRPDKSVRTIWRSRPSENDLRERDLEVALPEASELTQLDGALLAPGALPGLWPKAAESIALGDVLAFFDGSHVCKVRREGYEEVFPVPRAAKGVVEEAVQEAVGAGSVWLTAGPASIYREAVPYGILSDTALLHPPPADLPATAVLPQNLQAAWRDPITTAASIGDALSAVAGRTLPWTIVRSAIDAAIRGRFLERTPDSGPWPCDWPGATNVCLRVPEEAPPPPPSPRGYAAEAELEPAELQDVVDGLAEIVKAGAGLDLRFVLRLELGPDAQPSPEQLAKLNDALKKACSKFQLGGRGRA